MQILLIDDDLFEFLLFEDAVMATAPEDWMVFFCSGVENFEREVLKSKRWPDLILLDMRFPGMSAAEMLRDLRERGCTSRICLYSHAPEDTAPEGIGVEFIKKPENISGYEELVRRLMAERE